MLCKARCWRGRRAPCSAPWSGLISAPQRGTERHETRGQGRDRDRRLARDRRLHRAALRAGGCHCRGGRQHQARPRRGGGGRDRGRRRQGGGVPGRYRRGGGVRAPGAGGDRGLRHGGYPGEQCRHLHAAPHRGGHRGELGRTARAQSQGRVLPDQGRRARHEGEGRRQDHQYLVHRRLRRVPELQRLLRVEGRAHQYDQGRCVWSLQATASTSTRSRPATSRPT